MMRSAGEITYSMWRIRPALLLAAVAAGTWQAPTSVLATTTSFPAQHCRGSTRAHVRIAWPSAQDLKEDQRYGWRHVPRRIRRWAYLIVPVARANGVDPYLVAGVMQVESDGDPLAWELDSDAHGLMQVLHAPFQPADNIRIGVSMLAGFLREFGDVRLALAAYNAGPGNVQQYGGIPPFPETRDYVVMAQYDRDRDAGMKLSAARTAQFHAAVRDIIAFYKKRCGR